MQGEILAHISPSYMHGSNNTKCIDELDVIKYNYKRRFNLVKINITNDIHLVYIEFCDDFRSMRTSTSYGKIISKFLEPLLSGQVIYTPNNAATQNIMKKV